MKRVVAVPLSIGGLLLAAALASGVGTPTASPTATGGPTSLQTAVLETVTRLAPPPPAKFTRTIWATSSLNRSELMLDFCRGPVSIDLGAKWPVLVAEHDYCGGSAWMPRLEPGEAISLSGEGIETGTYVVKEIGHGRRGHAKVRDLPRTDIVLQTCVSPQDVVLVGLDLFEPTLQS